MKDAVTTIFYSFIVLFQFKYAKISSHVNGSVKKGVVFATYSSLIGESTSSESKYRTRFKQLVHWLGKDFDGCVSFRLLNIFARHKCINVSLADTLTRVDITCILVFTVVFFHL